MKINSIRKVNYSGKVHNFHCHPDETYVVGGVVVHNCYKLNSINALHTTNLSLVDFETIISKMPKVLTQVAFGICDVTTNPDFFAMMEHCRSIGIIPNYTCNGNFITDEVAEKTSKLCGAVAVSIVNKENSFNAVSKFTKYGMKQVNFHKLLSEETYEECMSLADEIASDPRLSGLNAVVFLQYKDKNSACGFHSMLDESKYLDLYKYYTSKKINIGFDSCSCNLFLRSISKEPNYEEIAKCCEPCEGFGMFSSYINCEGKFFPCSFSEGMGDWKDGIDVLNCQDFIKDVWESPTLVKYRNIMLSNGRNCPIYKI